MRVKRFKCIKNSWLIVMIVAFGLTVFTIPSFALNQYTSKNDQSMSKDVDQSMNKDIEAKAKKMKMDDSRVVNEVKNGKNIKFTSAKLDHIRSLQELEQGEVIGVLQNDIPGDETQLPAGKYHIYVKKVGGQWKAYAHGNNKVAAESSRVTVEEKNRKDISNFTPQFKSEGFCICDYACAGQQQQCYQICTCW